MSTKHTPENTVLWRDPLQPSPGTVPVPAGSPVIRDGRRVRLDRTEHAWVFTIPSSRAAQGVPDHSLTVALDGSWALCSCGACVNRDRCTLVDNPRAVLAHHGLLPPADPGGAVGEPREMAGLTECEDTARPAAPGLIPGPTPLFDADLAAAIAAPPTLDELVATGGDRWLVSRTPPRVTLTCASCAGTYRFDGEEQARRFVELALPCDQCGSVAGPTPPAPGAARKALQDHLDVLYGGS